MEDATDPQLSGSSKVEDRDIFRDTPIRFLGYANELGESFKNVISRTLYRSSYGVAISYVLADAFDKARKEHQRQPTDQVQSSDGPHSDAPAANSDTSAAPSNVRTATSANLKETPDALVTKSNLQKLESRDQRADSDTQGGRLDARPTMSDDRATSGGQASVSEAGDGDNWRAAAAGLDALLWHGLATVAIPGFTINRAVWLTTRLLDNLEKRRLKKLATGQSKPVNPRAPAALRRWIPAAVGLSLIPLIVKPIDRSIDHFMDVAVRPYLGTPKHTM